MQLNQLSRHMSWLALLTGSSGTGDGGPPTTEKVGGLSTKSAGGVLCLWWSLKRHSWMGERWPTKPSQGSKLYVQRPKKCLLFYYSTSISGELGSKHLHSPPEKVWKYKKKTLKAQAHSVAVLSSWMQLLWPDVEVELSSIQVQKSHDEALVVSPSLSSSGSFS